MMKTNKLREILNNNQPSIATRILSAWPTITEAVASTGKFDYIEFVAEYASFFPCGSGEYLPCCGAAQYFHDDKGGFPEQGFTWRKSDGFRIPGAFAYRP